MSNMATESAASSRIAALLDAGSFVEIGGAVTARTKKLRVTVSLQATE